MKFLNLVFKGGLFKKEGIKIIDKAIELVER